MRQHARPERGITTQPVTGVSEQESSDKVDVVGPLKVHDRDGGLVRHGDSLPYGCIWR